MAKTKTIFVCQECGSNYVKWQGQCSQCKAWNSLVEEVEASPKLATPQGVNPSVRPLALHEIDSVGEVRIITPDEEMNRVLGGGMVPGGVILLGGEPGIGKSTLLLQLALQMGGQKVLYVSGEESAQQIKMRAQRIPFDNEALLIAPQTQLTHILHYIENEAPDWIIIDSIQTIFSETLESSPGSVSQVRECAARLIGVAKEKAIPMFLVGHITKEGMLAGPKVLEHMVDTVLNFEGDRHNNFRIVRTQKNRFGSTLEMGIYEMVAQGLKEVSNPSEIFLSHGEESFSGIAVSATMEGLRPLLIETQALVTNTAYSTAQRSTTGFDLRRLNMLLAVLEKRCEFPLSQKDVFINIVGGMKVEDPALDLALIVAVISSLHDLTLEKKQVFAAEVGLSGEIRPVSRIESRISEAEKLGFEKIFVASNQAASLNRAYKQIEIMGVNKLQSVFQQVFS